MSDDGGVLSNWRQKVFSALVLLLLVALGARIATNLLEPLVPVLVAFVVLGVVGWVVFGRHRT